MKKSIVIILVVLLMSSILIPVISNAYSFSGKIAEFNSKADTKAIGSDAEITSARKIVMAILSLMRIVGAGVAIIMLTVLAIKYISAAPGDKADIKKHAVVYIIGALVLFASSGILGIIQNFADSNINN